MNEALGRPPLMLIDLRPLQPPMVVVRSHEVAEQISKGSKPFPYSIPKMPQGYSHMVHIIGWTSILSSDVCSQSLWFLFLAQPIHCRLLNAVAKQYHNLTG